MKPHNGWSSTRIIGRRWLSWPRVAQAWRRLSRRSRSGNHQVRATSRGDTTNRGTVGTVKTNGTTATASPLCRPACAIGKTRLSAARAKLMPTSSSVSRMQVARSSTSPACWRPPGKAQCPAHGSPTCIGRWINRTAGSGVDAMMTATAAGIFAACQESPVDQPTKARPNRR